VFLAVLAAFYDRFPSDERIAHAIQDIDVPALGGFFDFMNALGDARIYVPLTLGVAFAFAIARAGWEAALVPLTFIPRGLNSLVKDWVERPRPSPELVRATDDVSGFGFPSGHALSTAALFGLLFFLIPATVPWRPVRWLLQAGCLLAVLATGPARVYVGVHWPSDTLGGYLLAFLLLAPVVTAYRAIRPRPRQLRQEPEGA
jgi:undecaprenyl-diphosphatase